MDGGEVLIWQPQWVWDLELVWRLSLCCPFENNCVSPLEVVHLDNIALIAVSLLLFLASVVKSWKLQYLHYPGSWSFHTKSSWKVGFPSQTLASSILERWSIFWGGQSNTLVLILRLKNLIMNIRLFYSRCDFWASPALKKLFMYKSPMSLDSDNVITHNCFLQRV